MMILPIDISTILIILVIVASIVTVISGILAAVVVYLIYTGLIRDHTRDMGEYRKGI